MGTLLVLGDYIQDITIKIVILDFPTKYHYPHFIELVSIGVFDMIEEVAAVPHIIDRTIPHIRYLRLLQYR